MNERLKILRDHCYDEKGKKLSQTAFAKKIGISTTFLCLAENGERGLSERTINDICSVYNANKEWLVNGEGEMFKKRTKNQEISAFIADVTDLPDEAFKKRIIEAFAEMDEAGWEAVEKFIDKITKK